MRHNLDVMHIEKNIFENIFNTLMDVKDKTKDTIWSRYDLVDLGIRPKLHHIKEGEVIKKPVAFYSFSPQEKAKIFDMFANLKSPNSYMSNISRCVNDKSGRFQE